jgi:hypothetical protein
LLVDCLFGDIDYVKYVVNFYIAADRQRSEPKTIIAIIIVCIFHLHSGFTPGCG